MTSNKRKEVKSALIHGRRAELHRLREEIMRALSETTASKDFRANMTLALVGLHVTEALLRQTPNLQERRRLIREFDDGRETITKALRMLRDNRAKPTTDEMAQRRALP